MSRVKHHKCWVYVIHIFWVVSITCHPYRELERSSNTCLQIWAFWSCWYDSILYMVKWLAFTQGNQVWALSQQLTSPSFYLIALSLSSLRSLHIDLSVTWSLEMLYSKVFSNEGVKALLFQHILGWTTLFERKSAYLDTKQQVREKSTDNLSILGVVHRFLWRGI